MLIGTNSRWHALAVCVLPFFANAALALPDFSGPRDDDTPVFRGFLTSAQQKNSNVGIDDIDEAILGQDEMQIRIYAGFGLQGFQRGGHPLDLKLIQLKGDVPTPLWYPPCPGGPESGSRDPERAWRTVLAQELFTIQDSNAVSEYPRVRDGITYLIQIRSALAYREFVVSNPALYASDDNTRLLTLIEALAAAFDSPATCMQLRPAE